MKNSSSPTRFYIRFPIYNRTTASFQAHNPSMNYIILSHKVAYRIRDNNNNSDNNSFFPIQKQIIQNNSTHNIFATFRNYITGTLGSIGFFRFARVFFAIGGVASDPSLSSIRKSVMLFDRFAFIVFADSNALLHAFTV
jgi:hypothetical protein